MCHGSPDGTFKNITYGGETLENLPAIQRYMLRMSQPSDDQIARAKKFHQKMAVRILSTAEVVGGLGGAAVGVAIAVRFSFPVGAVFITHGGDHFFTGLEGIWTGEEQTTLTTKVFGPEVDSALSIAEGVSAPFILPKAMGGFGNPFRMGRGAPASTQSTLTSSTQRANATVGPGRGGPHGTRVHTAFEAEVQALGNPNLATEQSYLNGAWVRRGTPGSVRLDVVEGPVTAPTAIYDLKTGGATLTPARIAEIRSHLPNGGRLPDGSLVPVIEIR